MKIKLLLTWAFFVFILSFNVLFLNGQATFDIESGDVGTGYRILEGGADNDEVYNFALFNFASFGLFIDL